MFTISNYSTSVFVLGITMLCWGSWPVTQRLTKSTWRFELFYWDYALGLLAGSVIIGLTLGNFGINGRPFLADIEQASLQNLLLAATAGAIFNIGNLLFIAAINYAGMAVAFPVGGGLALVIGVVTNFWSDPQGNIVLLFGGVLCILLAMIFTSNAYLLVIKKQPLKSQRGIVLAIFAGCFFGFFFRLLSASLASDTIDPEPGKLTAYSSIAAFAVGVLLCSVPLNGFLMKKPFNGNSLKLADYFKGSIKDHALGILGGTLWCIGLAGILLASSSAGSAIAFGLSQGNAMIAAIWGVFVWKEFKIADGKADKWIGLMFIFYLSGLALMIFSGTV